MVRFHTPTEIISCQLTIKGKERGLARRSPAEFFSWRRCCKGRIFLGLLLRLACLLCVKETDTSSSSHLAFPRNEFSHWTRTSGCPVLIMLLLLVIYAHIGWQGPLENCIHHDGMCTHCYWPFAKFTNGLKSTDPTIHQMVRGGGSGHMKRQNG